MHPALFVCLFVLIVIFFASSEVNSILVVYMQTARADRWD